MKQDFSREEPSGVRILVCGLVAADIIFQVQQMPRQAEKHRADNVRFSLGGGGAIAAVALKRLGALVHLAGRLGDDAFAGLIYDELRARDIECSRVAQIADCQSSLSSIFIDTAGERQIVNYRSTAADDQTNMVDLLGLGSLTGATSLDAVLVDTRWEKAALLVLHYARAQHIPAVIDAEAPVSHAAMALATHVAFSRQGLRDYSAADTIEQGLRRAAAQFGNWVCVTDGAKGVFYLHNDRIVRVVAFPTVALDTLGAGDVWHAAFTLQLARGIPEHAAIVFANAAASLKCASAAGIDAAPDFQTAMSLANEQLIAWKSRHF